MRRTAVLYLSSPDAAIDQASGVEILAVEGDIAGSPRSGLAVALEHIAGGRADVLVALRLADVAGTLRELIALLDWLEASAAQLVLSDVGLDTGSRAGALTVRALRELDRVEREHQTGGPRRGRPGIARHMPALGERIRELREDGLSLQAIAERLEAEGVATPRGGERWRPSSVQAALGYRRPRPPAPGAPRPAKPKDEHRPKPKHEHKPKPKRNPKPPKPAGKAHKQGREPFR